MQGMLGLLCSRKLHRDGSRLLTSTRLCVLRSGEGAISGTTSRGRPGFRIGGGRRAFQTSFSCGCSRNWRRCRWVPIVKRWQSRRGRWDLSAYSSTRRLTRPTLSLLGYWTVIEIIRPDQASPPHRPTPMRSDKSCSCRSTYDGRGSNRLEPSGFAERGT